MAVRTTLVVLQQAFDCTGWLLELAQPTHNRSEGRNAGTKIRAGGSLNEWPPSHIRPEINPNSFVFFYVMDERSYSIREYPDQPPERVRYASEFPYTASEICRMATRPGNHFFEGEKRNTKDFMYWQQRISRLNESFLRHHNLVLPSTPADTVDIPTVQSRYPLLNQAELMRLQKAGKRQDMQRILESPNSEDYVTWNVFQLMRLSGPDWWGSWLKLAYSKNPATVAGLRAEDVPEVHHWQCVQSPPAYEKASRQRMAASSIPEWVRRAADPSAVEGTSEIDIALKGRQYVIYIEAKLSSDISTRTTYDPDRNQIVRNIDCLIEGADSRIPLFWMIARDDAPGRSYMQVINNYRSDPAQLAASLPHRNKAVLEQIANRITVFLWREVLKFIRRPVTQTTNGSGTKSGTGSKGSRLVYRSYAAFFLAAHLAVINADNFLRWRRSWTFWPLSSERVGRFLGQTDSRFAPSGFAVLG